MGLELPPLRRAMAIQVGLAFIAGFLEACGLIALFGLFIGHVTANIAILGMAIATHAPGSAPKLLERFSIKSTRLVIATRRLGARGSEPAATAVARRSLDCLP
jgi:uncharacterized membrane protein YoaK (UPF0700 family)